MIPKKKELLEKIFIEEYNLLKKRREEKKEELDLVKKKNMKIFVKILYLLKIIKLLLKLIKNLELNFLAILQ